MNKESIIELQRIDCNCNDCYNLEREITNTKGIPYPILYGWCLFKLVRVSFIANICQLNTRDCFIHRKDYNL